MWRNWERKKISSVEEEKALEEVRIKRAKAELAELEMQELKENFMRQRMWSR